MLTRHADVQAALRDQRLSSHPRHTPPERLTDRGGLGFLGEASIELLLVADPPDHTRLRRLASKAFTPRAVEALRPRVQVLVDRFIDRALDHGGLDVMAELAEPLPVMVICDLLGVPETDQDQFKPWSNAIARMLDFDAGADHFDDALPAVMGFVQYFGALIEQRRADPRDDLLSNLIAAEADGDALTHQELFAMIILLFIAGHETTTNLIGNATLALLRHPDQLARLQADPTLVPGAVEELLRYDSPVQITVRTATCDLDLNGVPLQQGEGVVCGLAAANRDARRYPDPDRLDVARDASGHLAFGNGMHYCLGAPLARLEGHVVFETLVRRCGTLELTGHEPRYRDHFVLRGLAELPVTVAAKQGR